jgi:hypothetical protein
VCAGLLVSGCSFSEYFFKIYLLKGFTFYTHNCHLGDGYSEFWFPELVIGRPGASTLAPWETMGRSRSTWEHLKGHLGVQAWIFIDLEWILGSILNLFMHLGPN